MLFSSKKKQITFGITGIGLVILFLLVIRVVNAENYYSCYSGGGNFFSIIWRTSVWCATGPNPSVPDFSANSNDVYVGLEGTTLNDSVTLDSDDVLRIGASSFTINAPGGGYLLISSGGYLEITSAGLLINQDDNNGGSSGLRNDTGTISVAPGGSIINHDPSTITFTTSDLPYNPGADNGRPATNVNVLTYATSPYSFYGDYPIGLSIDSSTGIINITGGIVGNQTGVLYVQGTNGAGYLRQAVEYTLDDTTAPSVLSITAPAGTYGSGDTVPITVTFSEITTIVEAEFATLNLHNGGTAVYDLVNNVNGSQDSYVFEYTVGNEISGETTELLRVTESFLMVDDLYGNATTLTIAYGIDIPLSDVVIDVTPAPSDSESPTILSVSSDKPNGTYTAGEIIDIDVTFSENVTSTGDVTVTLETGATDRTCVFTLSGSYTNMGTCNYTVQAGDTSADLTVSSISGAIEDQSANAMSDFSIATNLAVNKTLVIDTTAPTVSITAPIDTASVSGSSVTLTASASDTNLAGVTFKRNTNTVIGAEDTSAPYSITWDTTALADGEQTLIAVARDTAGNYATSSAITVTVNNVPDTVPGSEGGGGGRSGGGQSYTRSYTTNDNEDASTSDTTSTEQTSDTDTTTSSDTTVTVERVDTILATIRTLLADPTPDVVVLTNLISELKTIFEAFESTSTTTPATTTFTTDLTLGMNHPEVQLLQQFLNRTGFTVAATGPGSVGQETTIFGYATQAALIQFQRFYNIIPAIGFFGAITRGVVNGML